ncbi:unnamed protein product, partial [Ostreobium quekettii]
DSGGPLVLSQGVDGDKCDGRPENDVIVGIISLGNSCTQIDTGAAYTSISAFYPWIEEVTSRSCPGDVYPVQVETTQQKVTCASGGGTFREAQIRKIHPTIIAQIITKIAGILFFLGALGTYLSGKICFWTKKTYT